MPRVKGPAPSRTAETTSPPHVLPRSRSCGALPSFDAPALLPVGGEPPPGPGWSRLADPVAGPAAQAAQAGESSPLDAAPGRTGEGGEALSGPRWVHKQEGIFQVRRLPPAGLQLPEVRVSGDVLRVLVVGDTGEKGDGAKSVARAMARWSEARRTHFAVHVGDIVYGDRSVTSDTDPRLATQLFEPFEKTAPMYLALGNHEYGTAKAGAGTPSRLHAAVRSRNATHRSGFQLPCRYYSFRYANRGFRSEFFVLDSSVFAADPGQRAWLDRALARSRARLKVIIAHHPLSAGEPDEATTIRAALQPILEKHAVDLYLAGHSHDLQIRDGAPPTLISGAGSKVKVKKGMRQGADYSPGETGTLGFFDLELRRDELKVRVIGVDPEAGGEPCVLHDTALAAAHVRRAASAQASAPDERAALPRPNSGGQSAGPVDTVGECPPPSSASSSPTS